MSNAKASIAGAAPVTGKRPVRLRRSGNEVRALIAASARAVFSERGFAGATTREIADRAGASEVLIFRYFGSKAALFEAIIVAPFDKLIGDFLDSHRDVNSMPDRLGGNEEFIQSVYPFLKKNSDLLLALAKSAGPDRNGGPMHGLDNYFARAAERVQLQYQREGLEADISPDLSVRFGFGMLAAAILFQDWFFPDGEPDEREVTHALSQLLYKAFSPAPPEGQLK
jgi:AcrR family transcriptional regulator